MERFHELWRMKGAGEAKRGAEVGGKRRGEGGEGGKMGEGKGEAGRRGEGVFHDSWSRAKPLLQHSSETESDL